MQHKGPLKRLNLSFAFYDLWTKYIMASVACLQDGLWSLGSWKLDAGLFSNQRVEAGKNPSFYCFRSLLIWYITSPWKEEIKHQKKYHPHPNQKYWKGSENICMVQSLKHDPQNTLRARFTEAFVPVFQAQMWRVLPQTHVLYADVSDRSTGLELFI